MQKEMKRTVPVNLEVYKGLPPGHVGNLNQEQQQALSKLKQKMKHFIEANRDLIPIMEHLQERDRMVGEHEDVQYLQFLRAKNFDVDKAFAIMSETMRWRKDFHGIGVDNIRREDVESEIESGKVFYHGKDKLGRPCLYIKTALHDKSIDRNILEKHAIYMFEEMRWKVLRPPAENSTIIFDMKDFSIQKNMDYQFLKFLISIFESKYPETLGLALIVDSPWIFNACWKIIRPWLDPNTANKVQFTTKAELTTWIDENELLADLGGKSHYHYQAQ